jgi:hypothetical protein
MEQQITITHNAKAEPGYQWVLRATDSGCMTRICFATQQLAEQYVILCALHNQPI